MSEKFRCRGRTCPAPDNERWHREAYEHLERTEGPRSADEFAQRHPDGKADGE